MQAARALFTSQGFSHCQQVHIVNCQPETPSMMRSAGAAESPWRIPSWKQFVMIQTY